MPQPGFLVVAENGNVREELSADLGRRFAADYRVVGVASPTTALTMLAELARASEDVTLLIADERLTEMGAVDFLARAHELHPAAKRVLLIERGDWSATHPAISALALAQIDYHLYNPWRPLERILYAAVSEFLAAWERHREPMAVAFRIIGAEHSRRSHELRDVLTRAGVPYWSYKSESIEGRALLREVGLDGSRLPVAVHFDGTVLIEPSYPDIVAKLGPRTPTGSTRATFYVSLSECVRTLFRVMDACLGTIRDGCGVVLVTASSISRDPVIVRGAAAEHVVAG